MKKKKTLFTWYYILIGLVIFVWTFFNLSNQKNKPTLRQFNVQLSSDIESVEGSRNPADYKFYTENEQARFIILDGSLNNDQNENISNLKKGSVIEISIDTLDSDRLNSKNQEVIIYELKHNNNAFLSFEDFKNNRNKRNVRINIFFMLFGLLAILKGIHISNKIRTIIFFGAIILFIVARMLDIGY
ncbi:hypothetical protein KFE94_07680 [bacterium SCSIO 12643]|nr:hypothetical protein KFE94_07680 [bacterium SCSIO 12643]